MFGKSQQMSIIFSAMKKYSVDFTYHGQETEAVCIDCGEFENKLKKRNGQGTETRRE